jgi:transposase
MTNIYDKTIRKWIHRFNDNGTDGLFTEIDYSRMVKINDKARKEILVISSTSPRELGLKFSLHLVTKDYCGICKAKEDSTR